MVAKRGVSWLSSTGHEWSVAPHGMPARNRVIVPTAARPSYRGDGVPE